MQTPPLTHDQKRNWLRLRLTAAIGPVTHRALINRYGGAEAAMEALEAGALGPRARDLLPLAPWSNVDAVLEKTNALGLDLIALGEAAYPRLLSAIPAAPSLIWTRGELVADGAVPSVAIVGARDCSAAARHFAELLARDLAAAGAIVVSGLARGIDGAAHAATLESGTIAVVAGGIDQIYPPEHADLHRAIAVSGLLVSENPPGLVAKARHFPRRNRIISGLAHGVVVIEAAARSGTLVTARYALEQGREVFAAPGHPLDPRTRGTNALLRDGATLITCADDVLEAIEPMVGRVPNWTTDATDARGLGVDQRSRAPHLREPTQQPIALGATARNDAPSGNPFFDHPQRDDAKCDDPEAGDWGDVDETATDDVLTAALSQDAADGWPALDAHFSADGATTVITSPLAIAAKSAAAAADEPVLAPGSQPTQPQTPGHSEEWGHASGQQVTARANVEAALTHAPVDIDVLADACGVPIGRLQSVLIELECEGRLVRNGDNTVARHPNA